MNLPLEDTFEDIVGKAARGQGIELQVPDRSAARAIALRLGLSPDALAAIADGTWRPREVPPVSGFAMFTTRFDDMMVNNYVLFDPATREAAAFDTGADCSGVLEMGVQVRGIFLTHLHGDHVFDLDRLRERTGAAIHVSGREPLEGAVPFEDGEVFGIGSLRIEARRSSGHAKGGTTFVVEGLGRTFAIVGDALFAGSMGGANLAYREAIETARSSILSLPEDTILCPGHGPLTTVAEEKMHNPFFAGT